MGIFRRDNHAFKAVLLLFVFIFSMFCSVYLWLFKKIIGKPVLGDE